MSTMVFSEEQIIELCKVDAEIVNKALSVSERLGIAAIKNSIDNFRKIIRFNKSDFVPNLDIDYRIYITKLLVTAIESASEENKAIIFREIVLPS